MRVVYVKQRPTHAHANCVLVAVVRAWVESPEKDKIQNRSSQTSFFYIYIYFFLLFPPPASLTSNQTKERKEESLKRNRFIILCGYEGESATFPILMP